MISLLKKFTFPIAILAVVLGTTTQAQAASTVKDLGPLTVWVMGDSGSNFEKLVDPFTKSTGISVKVVAIPWGDVGTKLTTAVASGIGPDITQIGLSMLRTFADAGVLKDLSNIPKAYINLKTSRFASGVSGTATDIKGQRVSIPWISDTRVLFYRSDILAASGIKRAPKTWTELRVDAKILTARGPGKYGYYIPQWDNALPVEMTWDAGGDVIDKAGNVNLNTVAFNKTVDLYTGLYFDKSVPSNSDFDQTQGFISGVTPMLVSGPYLAQAIKSNAPDLAGKWKITTLPSDVTGTSLFAGSNMGVWQNTKHMTASLKLLDYLSAPATQLKWYSINGDLPTVKSALSNSSFMADPLAKVYAKQLKNAKLLPLISNYDGGLGSSILKALNSIVLNGVPRSTALATLYSATKDMSLN